MKDKIISEAIKQIKEDMEAGDHTAICELLEAYPLAKLIDFLPEEKQILFFEEEVRYTMPTAWSPGGIQSGVKLTYPTKE
jgi:hypothetical protein